MNERIESLIELAEEWNTDGDVDKCEVDLYKFAELIVRECAEIAKHHVMNISTYADADFVDEQIKEHFGVEQ